MATPPVVSDVIDGSTQASGTKLSFITLLSAFLAAVVLSVLILGAIGYMLLRSGRLPLVARGSSSVQAPKPTVAVPELTHDMVLEPMVVNLADEGGKAYLRIGLTLRVVDAKDAKDAKPKEEKSKDEGAGSGAEAAVRDTTLDVLGRQTADELLAADGKERLKEQLKEALGRRNSDVKVAEIFFGEFLVQR